MNIDSTRTTFASQDLNGQAPQSPPRVGEQGKGRLRGFAPVFEKTERGTVVKLSAVFALIYFFSPNGISALPALTISFLLKDVLHMSAEQASYFGALTIIGWVLKPLWGIVSDLFPLFGLRRKSYLVVTTIGAAAVWSVLGFLKEYGIVELLILFSLSSVFYSFMDVLCDALMIETGRPHNLTARFQSIQWTSVYVASIVTALAGGYIATHWEPAETFMLNTTFPLVILCAVLLFVREKRTTPLRPKSETPFSKGDITPSSILPLEEGGEEKEMRRRHLGVLKEMFRSRGTWLLAFFIFFVAFSPSFGAPFFYYSVDTLKFDATFLGVAGSIGAAGSALGAILYGLFARRFSSRRIISAALIFFTLFTFFDLVYFLPYLREHLSLVRNVYAVAAGVGGIAGAIVFLAILNSAALAVPRGGEGTAFATLTAFWNVGVMGSSALGGYLFGLVGLRPLIIVSAVFTALALFFLPRLRFEDDEAPQRFIHPSSDKNRSAPLSRGE